MSAEPSMEDILSSIKRIIAEEGEPAGVRARRPARAAARPVEIDDEDDRGGDADSVLELNDPMPLPSARQPAPRAAEAAVPPPAPEPRVDHAPVAAPAPAAAPVAAAAPPPAPEPIVSQRTAAATRGSLEALSRMMVKPEPPNDGTLEGLVREMLRPMLAEWLDVNLPPLVEAMVEREIAKIVGAPR